MRKVILQEVVTIDGFAAGPNGELDFFSSSVLSKGSDEDTLRFMDGIDTILLGAVTYRGFVEFWPKVETAIGERHGRVGKHFPGAIADEGSPH